MLNQAAVNMTENTLAVMIGANEADEAALLTQSELSWDDDAGDAVMNAFIEADPHIRELADALKRRFAQTANEDQYIPDEDYEDDEPDDGLYIPDEGSDDDEEPDNGRYIPDEDFSDDEEQDEELDEEILRCFEACGNDNER